MEKGPIQVKMKLTILTMMVIIIMDHIVEAIRMEMEEEEAMAMDIMATRTITTMQVYISYEYDCIFNQTYTPTLNSHINLCVFFHFLRIAAP